MNGIRCMPAHSPHLIRTMAPLGHTTYSPFPALCPLHRVPSPRPHRITSPLAKRRQDYLYGRVRVRGCVLYYERRAGYSNIAFLRGSMFTLAISAFPFFLCVYTSSRYVCPCCIAPAAHAFTLQILAFAFALVLLHGGEPCLVLVARCC